MRSKISHGSVVALDYSVRLADGEEVETSRGRTPVQYLHGAGQLLPALEQALEGMAEGQVAEFSIAPIDAYGDHDPSNVVTIPRAVFPPTVNVAVGTRLAARTTGGQSYPFTVMEVHGDRVVIDLNHPLAGKRLYFQVAVRGVRAAGDSELFRGEPLEVERV